MGPPTLPAGYLVEMRVPGDIVPPLLQRHRARRAGLGVAASGGRGGRPAPDSAAGPAGPESQPRAGAQRGAHGPGADLARGDSKVRGAFGQARTRARRGRVRGERAGVPQGLRRPPPPRPPARLSRLGGGAQAWASRGEAKASSGSRSGAGGSPRLARLHPRREAAATARRGGSSNLRVRSMARLGPPRFSSPPVLRREPLATRPRCGAGGARRCGAVIPLSPMAGPRRRPRERGSGCALEGESPNLCAPCGASPRAPRSRVRVPPR